MFDLNFKAPSFSNMLQGNANSGYATKFNSAAIREPFARFNQPQPGGAQGPTPAPSNPFAGANSPQPSTPTQPTTAAQAQATQPQQPMPPAYYNGPAFRRPMPQYQQLGMPQAQPAQSVTQQASRGGAQSVSNYLSALQQAGASNNNAAMNAAGQMGAGPQAGFRGFNQNGIQTQLGGQYVGPQNMQSGLQFQNNMASAGQNYFQGNQAYSPALQQAAGPQLANTGGYNIDYGPQMALGAGIPQYNIPKPWLNPQNTPRDSKQWEGYFFNDPSDDNYYNPDVNPNNPKQSGAFYSNDFPGSNSGPDTMVSDERAKTEISPAQNELEDFMNQLGAYSYEYKNKEHGEGRYISPMAQEFEKSKLGQQAVITDPDTGLKKVDYGRLMGVNTAALALINQKLNRLESDFKKSLKSNFKRTK